MKFLKKLLISLIVIVVLAAAAVATLYVLIYDDQTAGFKNIEGGFDISHHLAGSVYDSLDNIKTSNYEDNKLSVTITPDQLNAFIIQTVQTKIPEFPETQNYMAKAGDAVLDSVYVVGEGENLSIYACVRYGNIIKTSAKISAGFSITEGNKLNFKIDRVKLGKYLGISPARVTSMLNGFLPSSTESVLPGLDLQTMTYTLDLNKIIEDNVNEPFVRDLLRALDFDAGIVDGEIYLNIATDKIFTGHRTPKVGNAEGIGDIATLATQAILAGKTSIDLELTESQFNALAAKDLSEGIAQFHPEFEFSGYKFDFGISDPYYIINKAEVETSFILNGVESDACFYADLNPIYDEAHTEIVTVDIAANIASVGEMKFSGLDDFSFHFTVEANSLTNGLAKIKKLDIDKENSKVSLELAIA